MTNSKESAYQGDEEQQNTCCGTYLLFPICTLSDDLKPSIQCVQAAKKASSALSIINRTFSTFEVSSFAVLYKTYVRCHMEYCVQAWNPYYRKDIDILEKIQKRAT